MSAGSLRPSNGWTCQPFSPSNAWICVRPWYVGSCRIRPGRSRTSVSVIRRLRPGQDEAAGPPEALEGREGGSAAARLDVLRDDLLGGHGGGVPGGREQAEQKGNEANPVSHDGLYAHRPPWVSSFPDAPRTSPRIG